MCRNLFYIIYVMARSIHISTECSHLWFCLTHMYLVLIVDIYMLWILNQLFLCCFQLQPLWRHILDTIYSQVFITFLCVAVWRAVWNLLDCFLVPSDLFISDVLSLVLGFAGCCLMLAIQVCTENSLYTQHCLPGLDKWFKASNFFFSLSCFKGKALYKYCILLLCTFSHFGWEKRRIVLVLFSPIKHYLHLDYLFLCVFFKFHFFTESYPSPLKSWICHIFKRSTFPVDTH